jgi:uncharacterized protein (TIGR00375 family)
MKFIADLHIHSKYARATSHSLDLANLEKYARLKGVNLLGTGDLTHPEWTREIKEKLKDDGTGILRSSGGFPFVLQTEISLVYTQGGKGRRVHHLILAPSAEVVDQFSEFLLTKGRVDYDGRPIFGMSSIELVEKLHEISPDTEVIPAHLFTPWFGALGSESGFDSVQECFGDKDNLIHAIETGLSSDPAMNWRLSKLDKYALLSFSDLHSYWPWRIGREATVFDINLTYKDLIKAIRTRQGLVQTLEFWPEEGKYHYSGHRNCGVSFSPKEVSQLKGICPKCRKGLTIGVADRVEKLADRPEGFKPENAIPFRNLIPLSELIAGVLKAKVTTKKVWAEYYRLIEAFGNEMTILLEAEESGLKKATTEEIAEIIIKNRNQKIPVKPGFDGLYGEPMFGDDEQSLQKGTLQTKLGPQKGLNEFI